MSIDAGILASFGLKTPDGVPILNPGTIMKRDGKLPDLILEGGYYIPGDVAAKHIQGIDVLGPQIGGTGEFRQKLGPSDQLGESSEYAPAPLSPEERKALEDEEAKLMRDLGIQ
jgi:hypothetical protein